MNKKIVLHLILIIILILSGCSQHNEEEVNGLPTIKIGVLEPLSGSNAAGGQMELQGIKLANELYPRVLGKDIELVIIDNMSDKVESANAAVNLINKENVVAAIGSWGSSLSIAAGPIFKEANKPIVGASCTNPLVTLNNSYYSRVCFIDSFQGTVMANYAFNEMHAEKVAIFQDISNDYSVGLSKYFQEAFVKFTGDNDSIVLNKSYKTGDTNFSKQLEDISQLKVDVIFVPGNYNEGALIVKQARNMGIETPFIATDTWEASEFLEIGGDAVEGVVISTFFTTEVSITKESDKFLNAYRQKYDKEPTSVAALGYDAYLVIVNAIEKSGSIESIEINNFIGETKYFEGAAGIISLNLNGDAIKSAIIKEVKNGEFKYLTIVEPIE